MKVFNTLTKKKEELKSINDKEIRMYSCGPTVYNYAHIGNLRTYIFMDILSKTMEKIKCKKLRKENTNHHMK